MTNAFTSSGLFGGLFCDPSVAAQFGSAAMLRHMLAFEAAWTGALRDCGGVPAADAAQALAVIAGFIPPDLGADSDRDGLPVPALVAALRAGQPAPVTRAIHSGATSQDVLDTAMVLACLAVLDDLAGRLTGVIGRIENLNTRCGANPLMARTRMQAALPATVSLRVDAWRRALAGHQDRLGPLRQDMAQVQVGGAIGLRDAQGDAMAAHVAQALGLQTGPVWHSDRSRFVALGHWLVLVAGTLGKIGQDVALMAQQGIDDIILQGGGGSSAMAHKHNPISAEVMVTLARYTAGQQGILAQAMVHEQERSGAAWALEWLTLPAMAEATAAALRHADRLLASVDRLGGPL
ncbi:3-carboxy-cis,cis-muconate cycloisomerase [Yoonia sp.]|uniref:3-carboxy-cis,cis-muconate cycloisomerase n=1 Tax=Yoonia sp. TaxID=2212373 RepID=UPI0019F71AEE|nr:3-carboxy-cis,cis-muconate cycloisomerase [Yoonia sp.]MBE0413719.1 3-carboxy-cis,cis-muconate cycloisomerase [Yoonia sp.]